MDRLLMIPLRHLTHQELDGLHMGELPRRRPIVVANPPGDRVFRNMIDAFLMSGGGPPAKLEEALRTMYPEAVVRPRELSGETFDVWYVYRDGHWIRSATSAAR
jgi:hypothetical protein